MSLADVVRAYRKQYGLVRVVSVAPHCHTKANWRGVICGKCVR